MIFTLAIRGQDTAAALKYIESCCFFCILGGIFLRIAMNNHVRIYVAGIMLWLFATIGCSESTAPIGKEAKIENALRNFVQSFETGTIAFDSSSLSGRVKTYLQSCDDDSFGATICKISNGKGVFSPYWFRTKDGLAYKDLAADSTYAIDAQEWLSKPLLENKEIWSEPYFDAGGGEIWMKTLSIPIRKNGVVIGVATTDMRQ